VSNAAGTVRIFDNAAFGYWMMTVERWVRLVDTDPGRAVSFNHSCFVVAAYCKLVCKNEITIFLIAKT